MLPEMVDHIVPIYCLPSQGITNALAFGSKAGVVVEVLCAFETVPEL